MAAGLDDDFQLVDFKSAQNMTDDVHDEDIDEDISHSDSDNDDGGIVSVSDLNSLKQDVNKQLNELKIEREKTLNEFKELEQAKKDLKSKMSTLDELIVQHSDSIKQLKDEANQYTKMNEVIKKEMSSLQELRKLTDFERNELKGDRDKLNRQLEHFKKDCNQLDDILSKLSVVPECVDRNKDLNTKLNKFYDETSNMEKEVTRISELHEQQKELIKEAKVNLESMKSNHIANCLKEFDKSVAYSCKECGTHISVESDIESRCYQVGQGTFTEKKRGYLFKTAANLELGQTKTENFTTGSYKIAWVNCVKCHASMGWKYLSADNVNNNAKVGKFCLARYSLQSPQERHE